MRCAIDERITRFRRHKEKVAWMVLKFARLMDVKMCENPCELWDPK